MNDELVKLLVSVLPLLVSLLTAVIGLIITALKYKKQKYYIAMLEEQNKFIESRKDSLTEEEVIALKELLKGVIK